MFVTCVTVYVKTEHVDDFIRATIENHDSSVKEPGNMRFDVLQCHDDPTRFLLGDGESHSMPGLEIVTREQHTIFALAEDDIFMDESLNLNSGYLIRHGWHRYAKEGIRDEARSYLLNYPCKTLIREVLVRDDLWVGSNPEINLQLPNPAGTEDRKSVV